MDIKLQGSWVTERVRGGWVLSDGFEGAGLVLSHGRALKSYAETMVSANVCMIAEPARVSPQNMRASLPVIYRPPSRMPGSHESRLSEGLGRQLLHHFDFYFPEAKSKRAGSHVFVQL